jgi:hypothetical protein
VPTQYGILEGVATLTNDVSRWGPWAAKIVTGDDIASVLYTVDTNGVTTAWPGLWGINQPEAYVVIPTNQDLYCTLYNAQAVVRVAKDYFTNYVGDLLVADEYNYLSILRWDPAQTNVTVRYVPLPATLGSAPNVEGATFAPITLKPLDCP